MRLACKRKQAYRSHISAVTFVTMRAERHVLASGGWLPSGPDDPMGTLPELWGSDLKFPPRPSGTWRNGPMATATKK